MKYEKTVESIGICRVCLVWEIQKGLCHDNPFSNGISTGYLGETWPLCEPFGSFIPNLTLLECHLVISSSPPSKISAFRFHLSFHTFRWLAWRQSLRVGEGKRRNDWI